MRLSAVHLKTFANPCEFQHMIITLDGALNCCLEKGGGGSWVYILEDHGHANVCSCTKLGRHFLALILAGNQPVESVPWFKDGSNPFLLILYRGDNPQIRAGLCKSRCTVIGSNLRATTDGRGIMLLSRRPLFCTVWRTDT